MIASMMIVFEHKVFKTLFQHVHSDEEKEDGIEETKENGEPLDSRSGRVRY